MDVPRSFAQALTQWPQIQRDIAFLRSLRKLRFITASGDTSLLFQEGSENAAADLRLISADGDSSSGGLGDVVGPTGSADENIAVFDGVTGKAIKDGGASIADIDPRGKQSMWIPAAMMKPSATGGCAALATINAGGTADISTLDFDASTAEYAQFCVPLPRTWDTNPVSFVFYWCHPSTATNFGVVWSVQALAANNGEDLSGAMGSHVYVATAGGSTNFQFITSESDLVTPGSSTTPGLGANLFVRIGRAATDPADTLAVDAKLLGVRLFFTAAHPNEGDQPEPASYDEVTQLWISRIEAAGGTFASNSKAIADALVVKLKEKTYYTKIKYLLPLLGSNLAAARVPLIDVLNVGIATNHSFVDADFAQNIGLTPDGSTKWLDLLIKASQLGSSNNGGLGYWAGSVSTSEPWIYGSDSNPGGAGNWFALALYSDELMYWGDSSSNLRTNSASSSSHYYGQRASDTDRKLYKNGSQIATSTTAGASVSGIGNNSIRLFTKDGTHMGNGKCKVCYCTDGSLTAAEITDLHSTLNTYLISPTGR